ncbi:hypothetical protein GCM10020256_70790 [Streptomyces thermocoprophilus]
MGGEQPGPGPDNGPAAYARGGLQKLDRAAGPHRLHLDLAVVEGEAAQDVVADTGDEQPLTAGPLRQTPFQRVRHEPAERAEVLLVRPPGAARVGGGPVAAVLGARVVAAGGGVGVGRQRTGSQCSQGAGRDDTDAGTVPEAVRTPGPVLPPTWHPRPTSAAVNDGLVIATPVRIPTGRHPAAGTRRPDPGGHVRAPAR